MIDLGIVNYASLGPESGNFRAIHRPEVPNFRSVCRLARARVKGDGRLRGLNRIETPLFEYYARAGASSGAWARVGQAGRCKRRWK
jgi:hypothetical protein